MFTHHNCHMRAAFEVGQIIQRTLRALPDLSNVKVDTRASYQLRGPIEAKNRMSVLQTADVKDHFQYAVDMMQKLWAEIGLRDSYCHLFTKEHLLTGLSTDNCKAVAEEVIKVCVLSSVDTHYYLCVARSLPQHPLSLV